MKVGKDKVEPVIKLGVKVFISGEKGESLFYSIYELNTLLVQADNVVTVGKQLAKYMKLVYKAKEERLLALIGGLSVEGALDSLLEAYIPAYKPLSKKTDFTFSMKTEIAHSLRLIPRHIINSADVVRKVRNEFAHELSVDCFESLKEEFKKKLKDSFKAFCPEEDINNMALDEQFTQVVQFIVGALELYKLHGKAAREYIYSEDFINELRRRIEGKAKTL